MSGRRSLHAFAFAFSLWHLVNAEAQIQVPKTWDEAAIASLEIPLADAKFSPKHVAAEYYERIPVRPIFKSYPVYHPDREPPGYFESLKTMDPKLRRATFPSSARAHFPSAQVAAMRRSCARWLTIISPCRGCRTIRRNVSMPCRSMRSSR